MAVYIDENETRLVLLTGKAIRCTRRNHRKERQEPRPKSQDFGTVTTSAPLHPILFASVFVTVSQV